MSLYPTYNCIYITMIEYTLYIIITTTTD